jgi:hypothetical protein
MHNLFSAMQVNFYNLHNELFFKKNHNASQIASDGVGAVIVMASFVTG